MSSFSSEWAHSLENEHHIAAERSKTAQNPPTTARRECCLYSAALLLRSAAQLLSLSTVDVVVLLGATAQKPPEQGQVQSSYSFGSRHQNLPLVWATAPLSQTAALVLAKRSKCMLKSPILP